MFNLNCGSLKLITSRLEGKYNFFVTANCGLTFFTLKLDISSLHVNN